jgi:hypothetical protein
VDATTSAQASVLTEDEHRALEIAHAVLAEYPKHGGLANNPDRRKYATNHLILLSRIVIDRLTGAPAPAPTKFVAVNSAQDIADVIADIMKPAKGDTP